MTKLTAEELAEVIPSEYDELAQTLLDHIAALEAEIAGSKHWHKEALKAEGWRVVEAKDWAKLWKAAAKTFMHRIRILMKLDQIEFERMDKRLTEATELLREVEWAPAGVYELRRCAVCNVPETRLHAEDCRLAAFLKDAE